MACAAWTLPWPCLKSGPRPGSSWRRQVGLGRGADAAPMIGILGCSDATLAWYTLGIGRCAAQCIRDVWLHSGGMMRTCIGHIAHVVAFVWVANLCRVPMQLKCSVSPCTSTSSFAVVCARQHFSACFRMPEPLLSMLPGVRVSLETCLQLRYLGVCGQGWKHACKLHCNHHVCCQLSNQVHSRLKGLNPESIDCRVFPRH